MPAAIAPIAGAVVGGMMNKGGGGGEQTASKEPWGPAAPHLQNTLQNAGMLEAYQQQNPWNSLQQTGYQNMATDLDAFRGQNNGLAQFANRLMGSSYQRGMSPQTGLMAQQPQMQRQGLLAQPQQQQGVFSIPQGQQYGLLDFAQLNPYTAINGVKAPTAAAATTAQVDPAVFNWDEHLKKILRGEIDYTGSGE